MKLSAFFDSDEFDCHDGTDVPDELMSNLRQLVGTLDRIRVRWGGPLAVISGYRTKAWNDRVGGAASSTHMTAEGADIRPTRGFDVQGLHNIILHMAETGDLPGLGGLGHYKGWVHVDVKKAADGHLRRWAGKGMGSER